MKPSTVSLAAFVQAAAVAAFNWDVIHHDVVKNFKWSRPMPDDGTNPGGFEVPCRASVTFWGEQYSMGELPTEAGLPYPDETITYFKSHMYPGSWDGVDKKGDKREVIVMNYYTVPKPVREWVEKQERDAHSGAHHSDELKQGWIGVYDKPKDNDPTHKVIIFAPGAIYPILPLWVAQGSKCEDKLSDLSLYKPKAEDKSVVAWPLEHTKPGKNHNNKREISFRIEAQYLEETDDGRAWREMWHRAHVQQQRQERKRLREEKKAARKSLGHDTHVRDEL